MPWTLMLHTPRTRPGRSSRTGRLHQPGAPVPGRRVRLPSGASAGRRPREAVAQDVRGGPGLGQDLVQQGIAGLQDLAEADGVVLVDPLAAEDDGSAQDVL